MFRSSEKSLADDGSEQRKETGRTNKHSLRVGVREEEARVETRSFSRSPIETSPNLDIFAIHSYATV
jgi:hypothetical protein